MVRESLQRWVGAAITGEVTVRLRRGEDYSVLDTRGPALSYHPDKLSMERTEDSAFGPVDRIGQLTMRNLDIADSRARLEQYAGLGLVGGDHPTPIGAAQAASTGLIGAMDEGGAEVIASRGEATDEDDAGPRRDGVRHGLTPVTGRHTRAAGPGGFSSAGARRRPLREGEGCTALAPVAEQRPHAWGVPNSDLTQGEWRRQAHRHTVRRRALSAGELPAHLAGRHIATAGERQWPEAAVRGATGAVSPSCSPRSACRTCRSPTVPDPGAVRGRRRNWASPCPR